MKKVLLLFAVVTAFFSAEAQEKKEKNIEMKTILEGQTYFSKKVFQPWITADITMYFNHKKVGMHILSLASKEWGEVLIGPAFKWGTEHDEFEVILGFGMEANAMPVRGLSSFEYIHKKDIHSKKGQLNIFATGEYGGSGYFYTTHLNYNCFKWLGIGYLGQSEGVWGPRVQFNFPHGKIWVASGMKIELEKHEDKVPEIKHHRYQPGCNMGLSFCIEN